MDISYRQFNFTRKLSTDAVAGCLVQEYETDPEIVPEIVNIISEYTLPDSIFSASSYGGGNHEYYRAKIDAYLTWSCAWVGGNEAVPWLQVHLPSSHMFVVTGVLIKQRCDYPNEYVTAISVKTSEEDLQFQEVIGNTDMYGAFDGVQTVKLWFPRPYSTPIWRIS